MKNLLSAACLALSLCLSASSLDALTPAERREHVQWMLRTLPEVPNWTEWQQSTGTIAPDFDTLPRSNPLPDPLRFLDGSPVRSPADWNRRRTEIRSLFEQHVTGSFPAKPPLTRVEVLDETRGEGYLTRNVRLVYGPEDKATMRVRVVIPDGTGKRPALMATSLNGWAPALLRRGYISVGFAGNDGMDDAAVLKDLYPENDFAALPRRAWAVQMVLDYLETVPEVDMTRVGLTGYSRDGKMATMAAALDERIAALIAGSTGVGGVLPWRLSGERGTGEGVESTTRMFPTWFAPQLRFFSGYEDRLPVDANLLVAMIAPRPILMQSGYNDEVSNLWGVEQTRLSAGKVYDLLGRPGRANVLSVPGFHGANDQERCLDWLDIQFGRSTRTWTDDILFPWDFAEWQSRTGESIDTARHPERRPGQRLNANSLADWDRQAIDVRAGLDWALGEAPVRMAPAVGGPGGGRGGFFGRPTPGPIEVALGAPGNPGQLGPDVPAWVIARRSQEFGWTEANMEGVTSRRIRFSGLTGDLYFPVGTPEGTKLPAVIWLHGYSYPLGYMWVYRRDIHPILALVKAGYAVLAYDQSGFGSRMAETGPFYDRFPQWSRLGRMVEDARAAIDALQGDALIDGERVHLFGYTLGATVALHTAAVDPRVKGVVSVAGFTPMRTDTAARGTSGVARYSHERGLMPRLGLFVGREARVPYDYDELIALIAPRPALVVQPRRDREAHPADVRAAVEAARQIYSLHGQPARLVLDEPDDISRLPTATQDRIIAWMRSNF